MLPTRVYPGYMSTHRPLSIEAPLQVDAEEGFQQLPSQNALEPGQYWRVKSAHKVKNPHSTFYPDVTLREGDLHLVTELFEFEGALHSVIFLEHPRNAHKTRFSTHTLLVADFLTFFDPVPLDEAKAVRAREQAEVMAKVQEVQQEMQQAQANPLALPAVQEAARKAVEDFEEAETSRIQAEVKDASRRESDLRRIHRRAGRRSEAKGNPLMVRKATVSDRLDVMIAEGVTSDGVRDLQLEAGRRLAIAEATSKWLTHRSSELAGILERVTPYLAEAGQLALASASSAIARVHEIERGITSLKLFTGDGVDVVSIREGADAPTHEPLLIIQQKLAMDEELAVHADVEDDFDCSSQVVFFERLGTDDRLLEQILPTPRCVVSMQTTRRSIDYGKGLDPFDRLMREIENKRVFLLVRNGANVHVVYSGEPSHEAAKRLFPTEAEIHEPFRGIDGAGIGLHDVAFGPASKRFDDQALHYKRFLILLCGLDHRLDLFGEFYPPEERMSFMSRSFQQRYFRFLENDDPSRLLGGKVEGIGDWMRRQNSGLRSGSRVVVQSGSTLYQAASHVRRSQNLKIDVDRVRRGVLIATEKQGNLLVSVPTINRESRTSGQASVWLTGPDAYKGDITRSWYLCIDRVTLAEVRSYVYDRQQRIGSIAWLRTLRRVEQVLFSDEQEQAALRRYLRESALAAQVQTEDAVDEAVDAAISTWRADHRGAPAPQLADNAGVEQLLSLVYPKGHLGASMRSMIDDLCQRASLSPLLLTRTGKNQFALYSVVPEPDRAVYSAGVEWGWVRRHLLKVGRTRASLGSESTVWLQRKAIGLSEEPVIEWPALAQWAHDEPEPVRLSVLAKATQALRDGQLLVEYIALCRMEGRPLDDSVVNTWISSMEDKASKLRYSQVPFLTIVLGVYQATRNSAPTYLCARSSLLRVLHSLGTPEQRKKLYNTRGFRSKMILEGLTNDKDDLSWEPILCDELPRHVAELSDSMGAWRNPGWLSVVSHEPGGVRRRHLTSWGNGNTRAKRRMEGGSPTHEKKTATLSWNRAIDTLMGIQPLQRRRFYKLRDERVAQIWSGFDDREEVMARRRAEHDRRYEPKRPAAIELAPCLWDSAKGRSLANRSFSPQLQAASQRESCSAPTERA